MEDDDVKLPVGKVLKALREHLGMTQAQFAALIGFKRSHLCRTELGHHQPDLTTLKRIADAAEYPLWKIIRKAERSVAGARADHAPQKSRRTLGMA